MKNKKTFTENEALNYFCMILLALYHIQRKNIVHRDLKPENLLVGYLGEQFQILKLADFGISKVDLH
jgi:aurora kinase, other